MSSEIDQTPFEQTGPPLPASASAPASLPLRRRSAPPLSLRVLSLLCIVLPMLVYAGVGSFRYRQIRAETEVRLDRALRIAQEHALKVLDTNEILIARVLDAIANEDVETTKRREWTLHAQLRAMTQGKPQIHSLLVQDAQGRTIVSNRIYPAPENRNASGGALEWHRKNSGGPYLSSLVDMRAPGTAHFDMSRGRYRPDGTLAGIVSVSLLASYFENFHGDLAADEPGLAITMLRDDGRILSRWPAVPNAPDSLSADSPVMALIRAGQTAGTSRGVSSVDLRERLLTYTKVGAYPVYLGTGMAVKEIRGRWLQEMGWLAGFGLPPLIGLFLAARAALRRTREALDSARQLHEETLARRRVEESLVQSQKLEALGRLTGGVAHDFNNALMVISNNLFLLKRKHPEADGPYIESIGRAVGSATQLTRQLLAFSRRQALRPEYLRLQERLPTFRSMLGPLLGSQIQMSMHTAEDTRPILVDPAEFELALINLAINARDAMPAGGHFHIAARNVPRNAAPNAEHEDSDDLPPPLKEAAVVVEVRDSGSGIEPHLLNKVFEPFFTTKPVGEGTGLGLSQTYALCQRAGGLATIESQPGAGTTVRLYFPAAAERPPDSAPRAPDADPDLGIAVLLVEDNPDVATALTAILEASGCTVTRVDRAIKAKDRLNERAAAGLALPDLLLSDVVMPGEMDGVALAEYARSRFPSLRIILMTGYAEQLETISRQGFEILPKPCSAEMLAAAIVRTDRTAPRTEAPGASA